jgi:hypothetical protein
LLWRYPPLARGRKQIQFPKRCVFWFVEIWTMDKVQKPSSNECFLYCLLLCSKPTGCEGFLRFHFISKHYSDIPETRLERTMKSHIRRILAPPTEFISILSLKIWQWANGNFCPLKRAPDKGFLYHQIRLKITYLVYTDHTSTPIPPLVENLLILLL